jgi:hypothetical protein
MSGRPDGYCHTARLFRTWASKLARGSKPGGVWFWGLADTTVFGDTEAGSLFSPLKAAAVETKELVADRYSDQVQTLMYESERVSGLQSLLYVGPDGEKLSHELRGFLPR